MYQKSTVEQSFSKSIERTIATAGGVWLKWLAMVITASFTGQAALYLTGSWFYAVGWVMLAEGAFLFWEARFRHAENNLQHVLAGVAWVIAITAIVLTDLASATLLAHNAGLFTLFATVPDWAQNIITYTMAILAAIHAVMGVLFHFVSDSDAAARAHAREYRSIQQAKTQAQQSADLEIARHEAETYFRLVKEQAPQIGQTMGIDAWEKTVAHAKAKVQAQQTDRTAEPAPAPFRHDPIPELAERDRGNGHH